MAKLRYRYANALLELSEERGSLEEDLDQAVLIRDSLKGGDVQAFLLHPHIPDTAKQEFFRNTYSKKLSEHLMGFLYLMVRKNREKLIVPSLKEYIDRGNRKLGRVEAKVVSAKALTEKQVESIRKILSEKIGMQVRVETKVDPDVIGGFYILVDGRVFDCTVRSELNYMRERLKKEVKDDS